MPIATFSLVPDDVDEAFELVHALIKSICWKFIRRFGGDPEEVMAEGYYIFVSQLPNWDPHRGCLTTWTHTQVWGRLRHWRSKRIREAMHFERLWSENDDNQTQIIDSRFPCRKERYVAEYDFEDREPAKEAIQELKKLAKRTRRKLVERLIDMGWSGRRIIEAFGEVRGALAVA